MVGRLIDPKKHIERAVDEQHGVLTARDLDRQLELGKKTDADFQRTQRFISQQTVEVYCPQVPANSSGEVMQHIFMTGVNTIGMSAYYFVVAQQSRLTHLHLIASNYVMAGTVTPVFTVYEPDFLASTDYTVDACEIDSSVDIYGNLRASRSIVFDWEGAIQLARDEHWMVSLVTSADYLPTTLNLKAILTFSVDQWV